MPRVASKQQPSLLVASGGALDASKPPPHSSVAATLSSKRQKRQAVAAPLTDACVDASSLSTALLPSSCDSASDDTDAHPLRREPAIRQCLDPPLSSTGPVRALVAAYGGTNLSTCNLTVLSKSALNQMSAHPSCRHFIDSPQVSYEDLQRYFQTITNPVHINAILHSMSKNCITDGRQVRHLNAASSFSDLIETLVRVWDNAIIWQPPDSCTHNDAHFMRALCCHFFIPQLCCAIEPAVSLVGGRIISSLDVPIGDRVAALASGLTGFENDMLRVRTKNAVEFSEFHGAFFCADTVCVIPGPTLPQLKQKLVAGTQLSLKQFVADIHAMFAAALQRLASHHPSTLARMEQLHASLSEILFAPCSLCTHAHTPLTLAPARSEAAELAAAAEQTRAEILSHCRKFHKSQMRDIICQIDPTIPCSSLSKPTMIETINKIAPANFVQTYPQSWKAPSDTPRPRQHVNKKQQRITSVSGPGLGDVSWIGQFERFNDNDFWFCVPPIRLQREYEMRMQKAQDAFLRKSSKNAAQPNMNQNATGSAAAGACAEGVEEEEEE